MLRTMLAAAAALALIAAQPVLACPGKDCDCAKHKATAAEKADAKDTAAAPCPCREAGKKCKCGPDCKCPNCPEHQKQAPKAAK